MDAILEGLRATSPAEAIGVVLGLVYLLLAAARNRWCFLAGGISSAISAYLFAGAHVPMQSALQVCYVAMSIYGFRRWRGETDDGTLIVGTWPFGRHVIACIAIVSVSAITAHWLAAETHAAWPFVDSLTTWASVFTTWLVARARIENWIYWIVIDSAIAWLLAAQGLHAFALLYILYLGICVGGFAKWLKVYRSQSA